MLNSTVDTLELSSLTKLPRTRIYEMLSKLAAKGLIEKSLNNGEYTIIPPTTSIERILEKHRKDNVNQERVLKELQQQLQNVYLDNLGSRISPGVELLRYDDIEEQYLNHLSKAKEKVLVAASSTDTTIDWRKSGLALSKSSVLKVELKFLISNFQLLERLSTQFTEFQPFSQLKIQLRANDRLETSFVIMDNIIYLFFLGQQMTESIEALVLRSNNKGLVNTFEWTFRSYWESAKHES